MEGILYPFFRVSLSIFSSHLYDRTRPFLFDYPLADRPFQHLCLILLFQQQSSIDMDYHPISIEEYLRDLCYMLMSISSRTFQWNEVDFDPLSFVKLYLFD